MFSLRVSGGGSDTISLRCRRLHLELWMSSSCDMVEIHLSLLKVSILRFLNLRYYIHFIFFFLSIWNLEKGKNSVWFSIEHSSPVVMKKSFHKRHVQLMENWRRKKFLINIMSFQKDSPASITRSYLLCTGTCVLTMFLQHRSGFMVQNSGISFLSFLLLPASLVICGSKVLFCPRNAQFETRKNWSP